MKDHPLTRHDRVRLLLESSQDYLPPLKIARYGHQEPLASDPMVNHVVPGFSDELDGYRSNLRALERLERDAGAGKAGSKEDPRWLRRERHLASGSYEDLETSLLRLASVNPFLYRVLRRTYIDGLIVCERSILDTAITLLVEWMPDPILLPAYVADRNGEPLHARIRLLAAEKPAWSQRRLAKALGTSQSTVNRALEAPKGRVA